MGSKQSSEKPARASEEETQDLRLVEQVAQAVAHIPIPQNIICEEQRLGGLITERKYEKDLVQGMNCAPFEELTETLYSRSNRSTKLVVAKQKRIHLAIRDAEASSTAARNRLANMTHELNNQASTLAQTAALSREIAQMCDSINNVRAQCDALAELLPDDLRPEPLQLTRRKEKTPNHGSST